MLSRRPISPLILFFLGYPAVRISFRLKTRRAFSAAVHGFFCCLCRTLSVTVWTVCALCTTLPSLLFFLLSLVLPLLPCCRLASTTSRPVSYSTTTSLLSEQPPPPHWPSHVWLHTRPRVSDYDFLVVSSHIRPQSPYILFSPPGVCFHGTSTALLWIPIRARRSRDRELWAVWALVEHRRLYSLDPCPRSFVCPSPF